MIDISQNPSNQKMPRNQKILLLLLALFIFIVIAVTIVIFNRGNYQSTEIKEAQNTQPVNPREETEGYSSAIQTDVKAEEEQVADDTSSYSTSDKPVDELAQYKEQLKEMRFSQYSAAITGSTSLQIASDVFKRNKRENYDNNNNKASTLNEKLMEIANSARDDGTLKANMQKNKERFMQTGRTFGYSTEGRKAALSKTEVKAGMIIPATLISGVNSDLPGLLIAQITQDIRDTKTGANILIPKGSRLLGTYDSEIAMGQSRLLVAWNRIQFPDASTIEIGNMGGVDSAGLSGFNDQVNNHYMRIFGNATLLAILGGGFQLTQPRNDQNNINNRGQSARETMIAEMGKQWSQVGMELIRRNMNIQPTIEIRQGYKFNILVNKDLILPIY